MNSNSVGDVFIAYCEFFVRRPFLDVNNDEDSLEHDGDGWWPFHIWEVRCGSVMALREIFTQQGASAGVFMPDLSWDGAVFVEVEDQVSSDGLQPNLRRPKFEDVSSSTQWPILSLTVRLVDHGWNWPFGLDNGQLNVTFVKAEPESFLDGA
ncbi:tata-binding protein-associated factor btaf1 [Quercus suber]|uniref:Tata-binding protein-associated factor btaf1 n=1 Tax=Quercus suber TaxID=58331 RepID=A0AAW0IMV7_QUESU